MSTSPNAAQIRTREGALKDYTARMIEQARAIAAGSSADAPHVDHLRVLLAELDAMRELALAGMGGR